MTCSARLPVYAMVAALALLYRFVMQRAGETSWTASMTGAAIACAGGGPG